MRTLRWTIRTKMFIPRSNGQWLTLVSVVAAWSGMLQVDVKSFGHGFDNRYNWFALIQGPISVGGDCFARTISMTDSWNQTDRVCRNCKRAASLDCVVKQETRGDGASIPTPQWTTSSCPWRSLRTEKPQCQVEGRSIRDPKPGNRCS